MSVEDLGEKEAVLGAGTRGIFTISHFDGYAAVLIQLTAITGRCLSTSRTAADVGQYAGPAPSTSTLRGEPTGLARAPSTCR